LNKIIVVAGGTGNLGGQIVEALCALGAEVRVIARASSDAAKIARLEKFGAKIYKIDTNNQAEIAKVCIGATCVVSAMAGLRDVIIDAQKTLLAAAVEAGVPRFIPSDYSLDFTKFNPGENRNLDLRREFHLILDAAHIKATTIFNGAFMDMLLNEMPMILFKQKRILYWGDFTHKMYLTTVANVAQYTAQVALDDTAPRFLRIAGAHNSPAEIQEIVSQVSGDKFGTFRPGGPGLLSFIIKIAKFMAPAPTELYPAWQGMQYMRNMIDSRSDVNKFENDRYAGIKWTSIKDLLSDHYENEKKSN
jgi:uncharacterized protein YbjT (DUF2867 family)